MRLDKDLKKQKININLYKHKPNPGSIPRHTNLYRLTSSIPRHINLYRQSLNKFLFSHSLYFFSLHYFHLLYLQT